MGWAEDRAREAVEASRAPVVAAPGPSGAAVGGAPSEFLEAYTRSTMVDCIRAAKEIDKILNPPKIVDSSGKAGPPVNPVAVLLATQARILNALVAVEDMLLSNQTGRPELRPVQAPGNVGAPKVEG